MGKNNNDKKKNLQSSDEQEKKQAKKRPISEVKANENNSVKDLTALVNELIEPQQVDLQASQLMPPPQVNMQAPPPPVIRVPSSTKMELDYFGHNLQDGHRYKQTLPKDYLGHPPSDIKNCQEQSMQYTFRIAQLRGRRDGTLYSSPYLMIYRDDPDEKKRAKNGFYIQTKHIPALRSFLQQVEHDNLAHFELMYV